MRTGSDSGLEARFIRETGVAAEFASLAEPVLEEMGFRLVRVVVSGRDGTTVQIMAERPDGTMTVEDCAEISRRLSPLIDVHDPMPGRYRLEISSPGIDRPLARPSDFRAWAGHEAKVELKESIGGRRRFRGTIEGIDERAVRLRIERDQLGRESVDLPLDLIAEARLVMSDRLIREALQRSKRQDLNRAGTNSGTE
jgi:ribosome maturation factor RimP